MGGRGWFVRGEGLVCRWVSGPLLWVRALLAARRRDSAAGEATLRPAEISIGPLHARYRLVTFGCYGCLW